MSVSSFSVSPRASFSCFSPFCIRFCFSFFSLPCLCVCLLVPCFASCAVFSARSNSVSPSFLFLVCVSVSSFPVSPHVTFSPPGRIQFLLLFSSLFVCLCPRFLFGLMCSFPRQAEFSFSCLSPFCIRFCFSFFSLPCLCVCLLVFCFASCAVFPARPSSLSTRSTHEQKRAQSRRFPLHRVTVLRTTQSPVRRWRSRCDKTYYFRRKGSLNILLPPEGLAVIAPGGWGRDFLFTFSHVKTVIQGATKHISSAGRAHLTYYFRRKGSPPSLQRDGIGISWSPFVMSEDVSIAPGRWGRAVSLRLKSRARNSKNKMRPRGVRFNLLRGGG